MQVVSLEERPDLADAAFPDAWPEFMYHDAVAGGLWADLIAAWPQASLVALDDDGRPTEVPPLEAVSDDERRREREAQTRRRNRLSERDELQSHRSA